MTATYRIHPGIGIARLGNSPDEFCISPEAPAKRPTACDEQGNPLLSADGKTEREVERFKDAQGRIKRQAARFQIYRFDGEHPEGVPLKIGDSIKGGGNEGTLVDIRWRVYLANKKACWYEFRQLEGEHGYDPTTHPRRNAAIKGPGARQRLIIDPGPRVINCRDRRHARFDRDSKGYATVFPPQLEPCSIDTLGEIRTDDDGRLLVLGGHGKSGSYRYDEFGEPRITSYANNDGWFDDTSDGTVMARLVMFSENVQGYRFIDVEYPAWVICGYPSYAPEILDLVTLDDVMQDLSIRKLAARTDLYGKPGTYADPEQIPATDTKALQQWKRSSPQWSSDYKPWFFRDIWPILFRPDEFGFVTAVLGLSNYPHNQSPRGGFDPDKLSVPPLINRRALEVAERECVEKNESGALLLERVDPQLALIESRANADLQQRISIAGERLRAIGRTQVNSVSGAAGGDFGAAECGRWLEGIREAFASTVAEVLFERFRRELLGHGRCFAAEIQVERAALSAYTAEWVERYAERPGTYSGSKAKLEEGAATLLFELESNALTRWSAAIAQARTSAEPCGRPVLEQLEDLQQLGVTVIREQVFAELAELVTRSLDEYFAGALLARAREHCRERVTYDPFRSLRAFLVNLLRQPGEENQFSMKGRPSNRNGNQPLMPLLNGDNPISNVLSAKFFRLTDYQLFLLRQWRDGKFYNEALEGWSRPDPFNPYAGWKNATARDLDRGVLSNLLGGSFCPGAEVGWVIRNPAIYREPYRIKADPDFFEFRQTAANATQVQIPDEDYTSAGSNELSQDSDFDRGLQPGDLTKYMAVPWQSDFNECTTQAVNVTYDEWNRIYPESEGDQQAAREASAWDTLWWPGHRPLQTFEVSSVSGGEPAYQMRDWSRGIPGTLAGDLKMVTAWSELGFVVLNPYLDPATARTPLTVPPTPPKYISVERNDQEGT